MELKVSLPHSCLLPVPIHSQFNPVHAPSFNFLNNHLNIIFPRWSLSLRCPHQNPVCTSPLPYTCYVIHHLIFLDVITWMFDMQYRSWSSSLRRFLHSPVTSSLLGPNIFLSTLLFKTFSLCSSLNVRDQVSHPYRTGNTRVPKLLQWKFWKRKMVATDHLGNTVLLFVI